jgi:tetratricopeptide (TPR) repeat protein
MDLRISRIIQAVLISLLPLLVSAQEISISEKYDTLKTYPFYDPNPLPAMAINRKVAPFYPYSMIDGYTNKAVNKKWKVIKLENRFITVTILPEVGGKVMGAVENTSGKEFVYMNHVMKFRAIGIRGPWTSGGIEHNFGLDLGHAPWAAAPVDYALIKNPDSSVTCVVGGLDLASRSEWRVKINLPKNKAYFETEALWFNPLPLHQAYLSWENAAFKASDDLKFFFPGDYEIGHDGLANPWPIDSKGRDLSLYRNNNFGGSKSYHVVGDYRNWFGGYYPEFSFGFGHWSSYSDAPGKKLWIWALSREGAIWEDLLTDSDGQYIEAQSGVKLNQAAERSGYHSPFTQLSHRPFYADTKTDYWFPVKETGGIVDANTYGVLNVTSNGDSIKIAVSPLQAIQDSLVVSVNHKKIYQARIDIGTLKNFYLALPEKVDANDTLTVNIGNKKLYYSSHKQSLVDRPVITRESSNNSPNSAGQFFRMAEDQNSMRNYKEAMKFYEETIKLEPTHSLALARIAELYYRDGKYDEGILYAKKVLGYSTYDGPANFIYGALEAKLDNLDKAAEAFSIASFTMEFRSASFAEISAIELKKGNYLSAKQYAQKSIDFNRYNLKAMNYLAIANRKLGNLNDAEKVINEQLNVDPLNHFARFEKYLLTGRQVTGRQEFQSGIQNEFPQETYLETALQYVRLGMKKEAIELLEMAPSYPTVYYWLAYLNRNISPQKSMKFLTNANTLSPSFVFPFRTETLEVFRWARTQDSSWKPIYYSGLIQWSLQNLEEAKKLFKICGNTPDYAPFYITRSILFEDVVNDKQGVLNDLNKAVSLNPGEWRAWHAINSFYESNKAFKEQLESSAKAYRKFSTNAVICIDYARALLYNHKPKESVSVLNKTLVLPQEGAREGHEIFVLANTQLALDYMADKKFKSAIGHLTNAKNYPENLGSGKPYEPDYRLLNFLSAACEEQLGNKQKAQRYYQYIIDYSLDANKFYTSNDAVGNYISYVVLRKSGKKDKADDLMNGWIQNEDSLDLWHITTRKESAEENWVIEQFRKEDLNPTADAAPFPGVVTRYTLFLKSLKFISPKK